MVPSPPRANNNSNIRVVKPEQPPALDIAMPHSVEAEEAVLGSLLIDRDLIASVAPILKPEYFFGEERASLYQAILSLYADRTPTDLVTLKNALKTYGMLGEGAGQVQSGYLLKLYNATPSPVHVQYYVEIVIKHWLSRQIITECSTTITQTYQPASEPEPQTPQQIMADHTNRLQQLSVSLSSLHPDYFLSHEKSLNYIERFDQPDQASPVAKAKKGPRLRFGWTAFDGDAWMEPPVLCLLPATLTTILGRTGGGKTIAAMQIADANAQAGLNVLYFHVELNQEQMLARRYCRLTGVPVLSQLLGSPSEAEINTIVRATAEVAEWPGRVDFVHCPNWGGEKLIQELKARHYALMASQGRGYDLVVLDYLQRLGRSSQSARAPEHEALAANVRLFSDTINELNIAGLMTSQVGRSETKQHEPPDVDEGLGTGDIERCSNQLLALAVSADKSGVKYAIRKNTFGEVGGTGELIYDARRLCFL